jgi:hypothetical protein
MTFLYKLKNIFKLEDDQDNRQFSLFICLVFVASAAFLMVRHEMWGDEIQAWLLIKDVGSCKEFLLHLRRELHPFLWYALIYPLKFIAKSPEIIKPLHLLVACLTAYIFCRNAPFSRPNKVLFVFGYFPFFEYGVISRNYSLVVLFSFLLATMYVAESLSPITSNIRLWGLTAALFLICQTHLLGVMIGGIFSFLLTRDVFMNKEHKKLLPLLGFVGGVITFLIQIGPPGNYDAQPSALDPNIVRLQATLLGLWRGFSPLPIPYLHFWNTNIFDISMNLIYLQYFLAFLVLLGSIAFVLRLRTPSAASFYFLGVFLFLSFSFFTLPYPVRFHGFIFIIFMLALWIGYGSKSIVCKNKLIFLLLLIHVTATSIAYYYDMKYPFSAAKEAAGFIKSFGYRDLIIVGYKGTHLNSLAGYLNTKIYNPQTNRFESFSTANSSLASLSTCEKIRQAREVSSKLKKPVFVVLGYMPKKEEICIPGASFSLLGWFPNSIVPDEVYSIWLVQ